MGSTARESSREALGSSSSRIWDGFGIDLGWIWDRPPCPRHIPGRPRGMDPLPYPWKTLPPLPCCHGVPLPEPDAPAGGAPGCREDWDHPGRTGIIPEMQGKLGIPIPARNWKAQMGTRSQKSWKKRKQPPEGFVPKGTNSSINPKSRKSNPREVEEAGFLLNPTPGGFSRASQCIPAHPGLEGPILWILPLNPFPSLPLEFRRVLRRRGGGAGTWAGR